MRIVSNQFTNRVKDGKGFALVTPGTPFDVSDEAARDKIAAGRAEPYTESEEETAGESVSPTPPSPAATPDPGGQASDDDAGQSAATGDDGPEEETLDKITAAILELDQDNSEHFLGDGRPNVKAINDRVAEELGRSVTADERDAAWAALQPDE